MMIKSIPMCRIVNDSIKDFGYFVNYGQKLHCGDGCVSMSIAVIGDTARTLYHVLPL